MDMKKIALIALAIFAIMGCNTEDEQPDFDVTGTWTLTAVEYAWLDSIAFDDAIGFTESYVFGRNSTFIKYSTRIPDSPNLDLPLQATGNYTIQASNDERFLYELELIFTSGTELVSNCGQGNQETLQILPDKKLSNRSWAACDGPGFLYQREVE
jgi:hypothetical protein